MIQLYLNLPENISALLQCAPAQLEQEFKKAAAVHWYQQGCISQEMAASIAGLDRIDFLLTLAQLKQDSFQVDWEDLDRELTHR